MVSVGCFHFSNYNVWIYVIIENKDVIHKKKNDTTRAVIGHHARLVKVFCCITFICF